MKSITTMDVDKYVREAIRIYGTEVLLERAIPDIRDGLKPVQRKIIYWMKGEGSKLIKLSKLVGAVCGDLHPHSDTSVEEACHLMTQKRSHFPFINGEGNWGSLSEDPGAKRYIDCVLHENAKYLLDYFNICETRLAYTGQSLEPIYLPAQIPILLITGISGIAVGTKTSFPPNTFKNVLNTTIAYFEGERDIKKLSKYMGNPIYSYGGQVLSSKKEIAEIYKAGKGSATFTCEYETEELKIKGKEIKSFLITGLPQGSISSSDRAGSYVKLLSGLYSLPFVYSVIDSTPKLKDANEIVKPKISILLKKNYSYEETEDEIIKYFKTKSSYLFNVTISDNIVENSEFKFVTLLDFYKIWFPYRRDLEKRWLNYKVSILDKEIFKLNTWLFINKHINKIIVILKTSNNPAKQLSTTFKLSDQQVQFIMETRLSSLAKKNSESINNNLKKVVADKKNLTTILSKDSKVIDVICDSFSKIKKEGV